MGYKIKRALALLTLMAFFSTAAYAIEPDEQTVFNSVTDFFATVGKSERDKKEIKRMRRKMRREYRQQKARVKKRAASQKNIKKQQESIKKKYNTGRTMIGL